MKLGESRPKQRGLALPFCQPEVPWPQLLPKLPTSDVGGRIPQCARCACQGPQNGDHRADQRTMIPHRSRLPGPGVRACGRSGLAYPAPSGSPTAQKRAVGPTSPTVALRCARPPRGQHPCRPAKRRVGEASTPSGSPPYPVCLQVGPIGRGLSGAESA